MINGNRVVGRIELTPERCGEDQPVVLPQNACLAPRGGPPLQSAETSSSWCRQT